MLKAFILIEVKDGKTDDLISKLRREKTLGQIDRVIGTYELIAVLETWDMQTLSELVDLGVLHHEEVRRVEICVCEPSARASIERDSIAAEAA